MESTRSFNRTPNEFRPVTITRNFTKYAAGSVLIEFGDTKVICTASVIPGVPSFIKEERPESGWLTAEYAMLPGSTHSRSNRDGRKGSVSGRTMEIQRLIGRTLRCAVDLNKMPGYTIYIDCDVIQADGGTRTTSINGACIALYDACQSMVDQGLVAENPFKQFIAAISLGINNNQVICDLDYAEDSSVGADCNLIVGADGQMIEFQLSGEKETFSTEAMLTVHSVGSQAIEQIIALQKASLGLV